MLNIRANIGASFYYYYQKLMMVRIMVSLIQSRSNVTLINV